MSNFGFCFFVVLYSLTLDVFWAHFDSWSVGSVRIRYVFAKETQAEHSALTYTLFSDIIR